MLSTLAKKADSPLKWRQRLCQTPHQDASPSEEAYGTVHTPTPAVLRIHQVMLQTLTAGAAALLFAAHMFTAHCSGELLSSTSLTTAAYHSSIRTCVTGMAWQDVENAQLRAIDKSCSKYCTDAGSDTAGGSTGSRAHALQPLDQPLEHQLEEGTRADQLFSFCTLSCLRASKLHFMHRS